MIRIIDYCNMSGYHGIFWRYNGFLSGDRACRIFTIHSRSMYENMWGICNDGSKWDQVTNICKSLGISQRNASCGTHAHRPSQICCFPLV